LSSNKIEVGKLYFEEGLPGFSQLQFFRLVRQEEENPFLLLQSLEEENVEFWVVDPFVFFKEYEFELHQPSKDVLRVKEDTPIAVINIVTVRPDGQVTVNLKAPIIINQSNRMAKQVILNEEKYQVRQPLFQMRTKAASE